MDDLIKKITAPNGGVFTGQGTNTYLIGKDDITIVDPGPNISKHKVVRCIEKNQQSNLDELLPLVYNDVSEMLHPIARMSLLAHIIKLEHDGKIRNIENCYSSF